jgi:surface protein
MFYGCSSLKKIPLLDTQKVTNFTNMFYNCLALTELPALNLTAGTNFTTMFTNASGIAKAPFVNIRNTFTFAGLMLSKAAIVDIFNGLASGVTSKTITVSSNPGFGSLTSADRLIATAKGWTIA